MVLWQGKEYYFGERPTETVLDSAPAPIKPLVIQFSSNRLAMGCVDDKGIRRCCLEYTGCASARQFPAVQRQRDHSAKPANTKEQKNRLCRQLAHVLLTISFANN